MWLSLLLCAATLSVEAETPHQAIVEATQGAGARALSLPAGALRGFPKAGPNIRFLAKVLSVRRSTLQLELTAVRQGHTLATRTLRLGHGKETRRFAVAPRRLIQKGERISAEDLELVRHPGGKGLVTELDALVGLSPTRALLRGRPIARRLIRSPLVIKRGQKVKVFSKVGALSITMVGEAISAGSMGDVVSVLNKGSRRVLEARVIGPGVLEVP